MNEGAPGSLNEGMALFTYLSSSYITCKSAKTTHSGETVALLYSEESNAALIKLDGGGAVSWGPVTHDNIEGTDVAGSYDGSEFAVTGHGGPTGIAGKLLRVDSSTGNLIGITEFRSVPEGAGPNYQYVYNECWGIQPLPQGGYALACGTGIEECSMLTKQLRRQCNQGRALELDNRDGAVPRPVEIRQSVIVLVDHLGEVIWQRVDQWSETGNTQSTPHSSAAEYTIIGTDGSIATVNDEGTGVGLLKLVAPTQVTTTQGTTSTSVSMHIYFCET